MGDWFKRWPIIRDIFPESPLQLIGPLVLAGAAALLLAVVVIGSGLPNLNASTPHPEGWAKMLHFVFKRSVAHHGGDLKPPAEFGSAAEVARGAGYYGMACAHCHSGPGLGQNPIALSMRPQPQWLPSVIGQFNDGELFQIVKHGVKYSGMPAYAVQDRDDEVWAVVSFLRALPKLTAAQFRTLAYGDGYGTAPAANAPGIAQNFALTSYRANAAMEHPYREYHLAAPALGFDDFSQTGNVVAYCSRCHVNGGAARAGGSVPNLTLLDRDYLRDQLTRFAGNTRSSGMMIPVATQLSTAQIAALADYYTANPRVATGGPAVDPQLAAAGAQIAQHGVNGTGNGACVNCHGVEGASKAYFPAINGQNAGYLRTRLLTFRSPAYAAQARNPMVAIARMMTPQQIDAAAAYYAGQQPVKAGAAPAAAGATAAGAAAAQ